MDEKAAEDIRRRVRAARTLTPPTDQELAARPPKVSRTLGITIDELAARIDEDGLGVKTLGNIERGTRNVRKMELRAIADATGLPLEFFVLTREQLLAALESEEAQALADWSRRSESRSGEEGSGSQTQEGG